MPVVYTKTGGQGHQYQVPDYPEAADGPKAFKDFADYLDLILPPVGTIMPYVGSTAPTGWLLCDGASYSSTSYPKLSALCGTKFGTASAGLFKVPDLKGRSIVGLDSSQSEYDSIGKTGGAKSVTLTVSNLPAHNHTATISGQTLTGLSVSSEPDHTHGFSGSTPSSDGVHNHTGIVSEQVVTNVTADINGNTAIQAGGSNRVTSINVTKSSPLVSTLNAAHSHTFSGTTVAGGGHTHTISGTISGGTISVSDTGSGSAVNTLDPYITLNHIIRAA